MCESEKRKEIILPLYAKLNDFEKSEDDSTDKEEDCREVVERFKEVLMSKKPPKHSDLVHSDVLTGKTPGDHKVSNPWKMDEDEVTIINGDTLLFRAMLLSVEEGSKREENLNVIIKELLIKRYPKLIVHPKTSEECTGMTPIHLAILKGDIELLQLMANVIDDTDNKTIDKASIKNICANGSVFQNTAMIAGTLLGVASLKFDTNVFDIVLDRFHCDLTGTNEMGDNVVHSLIKFAHVHPDKKKQAIEMLQYIMDCKFIKDKTDNKITCGMRKKTRKLLMMENKEKLNPLQLAAKRQQYEFFVYIMQHKVYRPKETSGGVYSEELFDITEIETLPLESDVKSSDSEQIKTDYHESVLEYIVHHQTNNAFLFADFLPVKEVINEKWRYYKRWYNSWFAVHFVFIITLSVAAVFRSKLAEIDTGDNQVDFKYHVTRDIFVTVVSVIGLILAIMNFVSEIGRIGLSRFKFKTSKSWFKHGMRLFSTPYSNMLFRFYFFLFNLLLFVDFIVASMAGQKSLPGYHNYCLIFAVIIGWYLLMFFLQGYKPFSFFTVLIQRVIADLLKFALVMLILLMAFSVAMFMIMQGADTEEDDFNHFGKTIFKMLTIMLGIGEIGILFQARQPILAVIVFVLFVLLTTILLLNALIALMSNACTDLMSNQGGFIATNMHCRLQQLSVILYLESYLPRRLCYEVGKVKKKLRYVNNEWDRNAPRRFWSLSSAHGKLHDSFDSVKSRLQPDELSNFNNDQVKERKKSTARIVPGIETETPRVLSRRLDITDIDKKTCSTCNTEDVIHLQSQLVNLKH